ncbi:nondiscriminating glutamyl-tRNA synthetase [Peptoclostridium litorale DSM 5388]|uniref:Glutamate--tRNA ligase n=1 Tax=Peptoclostridium litorale DSM 5388 TaxID=1121324 RepID=A0A069RJ93_PEPLI|nr:glutamate--tRNA ligase [Peptoclostridium litorale]KDR94327.1 glutamate--tRNA ligase GltX [Peptoclostridium litorale DSM 5388]SIO29070.1 nondiscriminating glutamyl-tRNA synthetase [Peptoclostridium litorale DSM 5388]
MSVRVRFAPSPTGFVHIGSLRTALYNYLFAKKLGGEYILRVEDTDRTRYVDGAIEGMLNAMKWAGIEHDEGVCIDEEGKVFQKGEYGPYMQSERLDIYKKYVQKLLDEGHAYYCFCSKPRLEKLREIQRAEGKVPKYDGFCRGLAGVSKEETQKRIDAGESYVIRLKLPASREIEFDDMVRGKVSINTDDLDDQVLIKADGFPTYHFAVVVDDHLMKITHVIRGEEWISSTPKHVYLYEVLGWEAPTYVHLPNILNSEKKKLSKRQGDVAVEDFEKKGYLPEGLVNYVALVGWSPEDNKEIFSMEELIEAFSVDRVSRSGGVFDTNKLNWINQHYMKDAEDEMLANLAMPYIKESGVSNGEDMDVETLKKIMAIVKEGLHYAAEIPEKISLFFGDDVKLENDDAKEFLALEHMPALIGALEEKISGASEITPEFVKAMFKEIQKEHGIKGKNLFMGTRVILTGQMHGPEIPYVVEILGKERVLSRIAYVKNNLI